MSKRTEQRLRRQIRDLEQRLAGCVEVAADERRKHANSYLLNQSADIYTAPVGNFPEWLQATCKTAWFAGGHVAMILRADGLIGFRFERRIYQ